MILTNRGDSIRREMKERCAQLSAVAVDVPKPDVVVATMPSILRLLVMGKHFDA